MSHFLHAASPDAWRASLVTQADFSRGFGFKLSDKGYWLCRAGLLNKPRKRSVWSLDRVPAMAEMGKLVDTCGGLVAGWKFS